MCDTLEIMLEVAKGDLFFVDNVLKAYEGLALVTVIGVEGEIGRLRLEVTDGTKGDVLEILENMKTIVGLEIVGIE
ncbi:DUF4911 domain-containing protein [Halonatronum saccharophilum]|uniref:DUF4911 domain-containing protein n=1 Tax=Halonatronum saccharophilum TaxID=150060 RepID=UPI0004854758|nr:DUF4911 domain-containing protein [Halonatronum saccharophilum]